MELFANREHQNCMVNVEDVMRGEQIKLDELLSHVRDCASWKCGRISRSMGQKQIHAILTKN
jgi:hypothetical protein